MDHRVGFISQIPQLSWAEEPENACRASAAGGKSAGATPNAGAEGAGGASSVSAAPTAAKGSTNGCGGETLAAIADCAMVLVTKGTAQKIAILSCAASSDAAVSCVIEQFQSSKAKP